MPNKQIENNLNYGGTKKLASFSKQEAEDSAVKQFTELYNNLDVKAGLAWHYKYFNKDKELADLERVARNKKIGLWSQPDPVAPWDFRKAQKFKKIS